MEVKVRNIQINTDNEPVMLILNEESRLKLIESLSSAEKDDNEEIYIIDCPSDMTDDQVEAFKNSKPNDDDASFKDKYVRLYADFDNFKKRTLKERQDLRNDVLSSTLTSVLDLDNDLHLALKQIKNEDDKNGIGLILSKLDRFLHSHNVEVIPTDEFNPDLHEAISVIKTGKSGILDVASRGYKINGKVIRHSKVVVSE